MPSIAPENFNGQKNFNGQIRVAARIIDLLSSGLYESPAACLKELINNSFDADAKNVDVFVKPDANRIIVQDDGEGMSRAEFEKHFQTIAESHKRDLSERTSSGRPKVGKIGIGVIAANELCEKLEIFSTKAGSTELLHVTIDFAEMRKPIETRRREKGQIVEADYVGEILPAEKSAHFTHMFLTSIRGEAQEILVGAEAARSGVSHASTFYGLQLETMETILRIQKINTWKDFDAYSQTLLHVALNVPVRYFDDWLPPKLRQPIARYKTRVEKLDFKVTYDGLELRKPIVFEPSTDLAFVEKFSFSGKHVSADGYFYAQHGSIKPLELHGLLVRIREAAVGEFDSSFWGFSASEYSLIQRWVSCEIWADDRLEDAMNIDRKTLRVTHPAYVELRNALHEKLRSIFSEVRTKIYEVNSDSRKAEKADTASTALIEVASGANTGLPARFRQNLVARWSDATDSKTQKALLKRYTVPEIYQLVIAVAYEVLSPAQREEFVKRLTDRLRRG